MMLGQFTLEEVNLICIFDTGSRERLIAELSAAVPEFDEPEMTEIAEGVLAKLSKMTGADFDTLELHPEYEDYDEQEE